jgi:uncharacterized DUF497 family protein
MWQAPEYATGLTSVERQTLDEIRLVICHNCHKIQLRQKKGALVTWFDVRWVFPEDADQPDDSNVEHVAQHGLSPEDVEHALENPLSDEDDSDASGRPIVFEFARDGRIIAVVYEWIDELTIYPITAFVLED